MFEDLYPPTLDTIGGPEVLERVDEVVYRRIVRRLLVPGLPPHVAVGEADVIFTVGPVLTQLTDFRQRPGLPFVFDKHMRRAVSVGDGEPLTVVQVRRTSDDLMRQLDEARIAATMALGLVCAVLDERIALDELAEDGILLASGTPIAAIDVAHNVRTFMPFDVSESDLEALRLLSTHQPANDTALTRAATLYFAGVREGPTPQGVLFMWLAVDAFTGSRKTQKREVLELLARTEFDLSWLSMPIGKLLGLRGDLAHGKGADADAVTQAFRDMEAVARAVIRHESKVPGGWPVLPGPEAFPPPLGPRLAGLRGQADEEWHDDALPSAGEAPPPLGLPRYDAARGGHSEWLSITGAPDADSEQMLRFWLLAAVNAADVEIDDLALVVEPVTYPDQFATNRESMHVRLDAVVGDPEPPEVRLAFHLCRMVAAQQILRLGLEPVGTGVFFIELAGTWVPYREWLIEHDMPRELLRLDGLGTSALDALGAHVGAALAGDEEAAEALEKWMGRDVDSDLRQMVSAVLEEFADVTHFTQMLARVDDLIAALRELQNSDPPP